MLPLCCHWSALAVGSCRTSTEAECAVVPIQDSGAIRNAVLRYQVSHPVVNDTNMVLWRGLGVASWPTLMVVSPKGRVIATLAGASPVKLSCPSYHCEGMRSRAQSFCGKALGLQVMLHMLWRNSLLPDSMLHHSWMKAFGLPYHIFSHCS